MTEQMSQGLELRLAGMGIVFLFLTLLVLAINLMSSLIERFFPEAPNLVGTVTTTSNGIDKNIVAAITAAVHQHRSKNK